MSTEQIVVVQFDANGTSAAFPTSWSASFVMTGGGPIGATLTLQTSESAESPTWSDLPGSARNVMGVDYVSGVLLGENEFRAVGKVARLVVSNLANAVVKLAVSRALVVRSLDDWIHLQAGVQS